MCGVGDLSVSFAFQIYWILLICIVWVCPCVFVCAVFRLYRISVSVFPRSRHTKKRELYYTLRVVFFSLFYFSMHFQGISMYYYTYIVLTLRLYVESLLHKGELPNGCFVPHIAIFSTFPNTVCALIFCCFISFAFWCALSFSLNVFSFNRYSIVHSPVSYTRF